MSIYSRKLLLQGLKFSDFVIICASMLLSFWVRGWQFNQIPLREMFFLQIELLDILGLICMIGAWHFIFQRFGLYRSRRLYNIWLESFDILKATSLGTALFGVGGLIFSVDSFSPLFLLIFWSASTGLTIGFRFLLRLFLSNVRLRGRNLRFLLIVGTNKRAYDFGRMIEERKELGTGNRCAQGKGFDLSLLSPQWRRSRDRKRRYIGWFCAG